MYVLWNYLRVAINLRFNVLIPKICESSGKYRSGGSSYIHFLRVNKPSQYIYIFYFLYILLLFSFFENVYFLF